jgi:hypothetical protein
MKALEFETTLSEGSNLRVPDDLAGQIPKEEAVRVIVLLPEHAEDEDWRRLASEQLLSGYSESDSIYDAL